MSRTKGSRRGKNAPDDVEGTVALDRGVVGVFDRRIEEGAVEDDPGGKELDAVKVAQPRELDVTLVLAAVGDVGTAQEAVRRLETRRFRSTTVGRRVTGRATR